MRARFAPAWHSRRAAGADPLRWVALTLLLSACSHSTGAGGTPAAVRSATFPNSPSEDPSAGGIDPNPSAGGIDPSADPRDPSAGGIVDAGSGPGATGPGGAAMHETARELAAARAARREGRLADASLGFERVIRTDAAAFDARLELVEVLLQQSVELGRAATLLDEARGLRSYDVQVDRLRGALDELRGDPAAAAADYARVLAVSPDPELRLRRASLLMRANLVDDAVAEYEKAVTENPSDRGARTTLAEIYEYQGRWADAERMLLDIERLATGELNPLRRLAAFYRRTGQYEKALEVESRFRALVSPPRSLRPLRPSVR